MSSLISITDKGKRCEDVTGLLYFPDFVKRTTVEDINRFFNNDEYFIYKKFELYTIAKGNIIGRIKAKY